VHKCTSLLVHWCINALVHCCIGSLVHYCTAQFVHGQDIFIDIFSHYPISNVTFLPVNKIYLTPIPYVILLWQNTKMYCSVLYSAVLKCTLCTVSYWMISYLRSGTMRVVSQMLRAQKKNHSMMETWGIIRTSTSRTSLSSKPRFLHSGSRILMTTLTTWMTMLNRSVARANNTGMDIVQ